jgi:hypothetical protein
MLSPKKREASKYERLSAPTSMYYYKISIVDALPTEVKL